MGKALQLCLYCRHDLRVAVADVEHRDPAGKIDVAATVLVPQFGIFRAGGKDGHRRDDATRNGSVATLQQCGIAAHCVPPR